MLKQHSRSLLLDEPPLRWRSLDLLSSAVLSCLGCFLRGSSISPSSRSSSSESDSESTRRRRYCFFMALMILSRQQETRRVNGDTKRVGVSLCVRRLCCRRGYRDSTGPRLLGGVAKYGTNQRAPTSGRLRGWWVARSGSTADGERTPGYL